MPENAHTDRVEELAKRVDDLESQLEDGNKSDGSRPSRRGFLGMLAASAGLGAAGVYGLSGRSSAATAQGYTRTGELRDGNDATLATLNNGGPFAFQVPVTAPKIDTDKIATELETGSDVTASRSLGTTYQNSNDYDIFVIANLTVSTSGDSMFAELRVSQSDTLETGDRVDRYAQEDIDTRVDYAVTGRVPAGYYYEVPDFGIDNSSIAEWHERGLTN
jgi:hypothetical protein